MFHPGSRFAPLMPLCAALLLISAVSHAADQESKTETQEAYFAGGCFWCMEEAFDPVEGVISTTSGYTGGDVDNPTYEQVSAGDTGHAEAVKIEYDPTQIDYAELLHVYWRNIDPFAENRQFCDAGSPYRSAIFYRNEEERELAEATRDELAERFGSEIATEIEPFETFYPAEEYHQNYYQTNAMRYRFYKSACGRKERLEEVWGEEAGGLEKTG
ncbi:peptide methionine sulfoxide reductase MsrA [Litchfieldella qijiaojingensis]|uniref:Peptide methionine sulfoxide reductase MsrA n=1 Tax=Litchfieldella qijiaojingensis TaxID=980347 RepID=A0ABQ2Z5M2_9GAMM|nr:peptide-methionine (S)-S-oxide reductase MsrA [Halomonas qijiaojingensis]GGY05299.1 peptide methionine sulfoxide reductase MsrA [Halomonas qijiaojingensis]